MRADKPGRGSRSSAGRERPDKRGPWPGKLRLGPIGTGAAGQNVPRTALGASLAAAEGRISTSRSGPAAFRPSEGRARAPRGDRSRQRTTGPSGSLVPSSSSSGPKMPRVSA
jgi:hypothetical protein